MLADLQSEAQFMGRKCCMQSLKVDNRNRFIKLMVVTGQNVDETCYWR